MTPFIASSPPSPGPTIPFPRQTTTNTSHPPVSSSSSPHRPEYYLSLSDADDVLPRFQEVERDKLRRPRLSDGVGRRTTTSLTGLSLTSGGGVSGGGTGSDGHRYSYRHLRPGGESQSHHHHQHHPTTNQAPSRQDAYRREKERAIAISSSTSDAPTHSPGSRVSFASSPGRDPSPTPGPTAGGLRDRVLDRDRARANSLGPGLHSSGTGTSSRSGASGEDRAGNVSGGTGVESGRSSPGILKALEVGRLRTEGRGEEMNRYLLAQRSSHQALLHTAASGGAGRQTESGAHPSQSLETNLIPPTPGDSPSTSPPATGSVQQPHARSDQEHFYFPSFASQPFGMNMSMGLSFPFPSYGGAASPEDRTRSGMEAESRTGNELVRSISAEQGREAVGSRAEKGGPMVRSRSGSGLTGMLSSAYDSIEGRFSGANVANAASIGRLGSPSSSPTSARVLSNLDVVKDNGRNRDESVDWDMGRPATRPFRHSFQALAYTAQDFADGSGVGTSGAGAGSRARGNDGGSASPARRARVRSQDANAGSPGRMNGLSISTQMTGFASNRDHSASGSDGEVDWHRPSRPHRPAHPQESHPGRKAHPPFSPYDQSSTSSARRSFDALSRTLDYDNARRLDGSETVDVTHSGQSRLAARRSSIGGHAPVQEAGLAFGQSIYGPPRSSVGGQATKHVRPGLQLTRSYTMDNMTLSRKISPQSAPPTAPPPLSRLPTSKSAREISLAHNDGPKDIRRVDAQHDTPIRSAASRGMGPPRAPAAARDGESVHRDRGLEAKVVLLGSTNVGKTSLAKRHAEGTFSATASAATVNTSLFTSKALCQGVEVRLQLWDTAGEERHRSLTKLYYRGAHAALIVYDVTDSRSFADVQGWLRELQSSFSEGQEPLIFVIGSKADLTRGQRQVDKRFAREQVASWLGLSPVPERSPVGPASSGFSSSGIDHGLTGRSPPMEVPSLRIIEPTSASGRSQGASLTRTQTKNTTSTPEDLADSERSPPTRSSQPFKFLSILGSGSRPSSEHAPSRPPSIHPNIAASRRAMTGARTQSVSAATALMIMHPKATEKVLQSASSITAPTSAARSVPQERDRRKSEDWSSRMKAPQAAVVLETTPSLGQPMQIAQISDRKRLESLAPRSREVRIDTRVREPDEDESWGKLITGTNVRVGEVSSKSGKGVHELFLTINDQLVCRRDRINRERLRRERENVVLAEGQGRADGSDSVKAKANPSCCGV